MHNRLFSEKTLSRCIFSRALRSSKRPVNKYLQIKILGSVCALQSMLGHYLSNKGIVLFLFGYLQAIPHTQLRVLFAFLLEKFNDPFRFETHRGNGDFFLVYFKTGNEKAIIAGKSIIQKIKAKKFDAKTPANFRRWSCSAFGGAATTNEQRTLSVLGLTLFHPCV